MSDHASRRARRHLSAPPPPLETRLMASDVLAPEPPSRARRRAASSAAWCVLVGICGAGGWALYQQAAAPHGEAPPVLLAVSVLAFFATSMALCVYGAVLGTDHVLPGLLRGLLPRAGPAVRDAGPGNSGRQGVRLHASTRGGRAPVRRALDADDRRSAW